MGEMEGNNSNVLCGHYLKGLQKDGQMFHLMMLPVTKILFASGR